MLKRSLVGIASVLLCVAASPAADDPAAAWSALSQPVFDAARYGTVTGATLSFDRIRISFAEGNIQLSRPVAGSVFGAAFKGKGKIEVAVPNALEAAQLRLFTGQERLEMEFSEAALCFSDNAPEKLAGQVRWSESADASLADLYRSRQHEREDVGAELLPRLFKSLFSADHKRTALFAGDFKTAGKGWVHVRFDALEPEEITVGRWTNWGGVTRFDNWLSFPAGDRSAAEAFRDPLSKEDFDIRAYRIDAGVTGGAELRATANVSISHRATGERILLFELDANLRVESVKDQGGASLPFFQPRDPKDRNQSYGDYLAVVLPQPAAAGQAQTLEIRYAGKRVVRRVGDGSYFCQSFGWYPTRPNSFATRADFELNFRNPKKYTLVATGNKVNETTDGDTTYTTWKSDIPLTVAGFAFGNFKLQTEKAGTVDVEIYANRDADDLMRSIMAPFDSSMGNAESRPPVGSLSPAALAKTMGTEVANTIRLFEAYFGPYPYKRLAVTNIPYSYGQGWPMLLYLSALTFLDSTQRNAFGIRDHSQISDFFRAHESSHQWWGHRVSWKSYHDQWLSEGFAQFSGNLYVLFRQNEKEYVNRLRRDKEELLQGHDLRNRVYESLGPIWMGTRLASSDAPRGYATVIYNKGGFVLHMLRMMLSDARNAKNPDERFMALMRDFCQTFHNKPASTEDFQAVVEKHMIPGMDLERNNRMDWFFRQYVYGTGMAHYELHYTVQEAGPGQWRVTGKVIQSKVPEGWKDILPVYVHISGRVRRIGAFGIRSRENPFDFTLPVKPEKISLNDYEEALAEIRQ